MTGNVTCAPTWNGRRADGRLPLGYSSAPAHLARDRGVAGRSYRNNTEDIYHKDH